MKPGIQRLKALTEQYGPVAMGIHVTVFAITMVGFTVALQAGFQVEGAAAGTGTLLAAYVATKAVSPLRIMLTLAATPIIGRRFPMRDQPPPD